MSSRKQLTALQFARVIVRDSNGRLLMTVSAEHRGGLWNFPGGKIKPGEAPDIAGARELFEETGVLVSASDLKLVHQGDFDFQGEIWKGFFFEALHFEGVPKNLETELHVDVGFFDLAAVRKHGSKQFVLDALAYCAINNRKKEFMRSALQMISVLALISGLGVCSIWFVVVTISGMVAAEAAWNLFVTYGLPMAAVGFIGCVLTGQLREIVCNQPGK